MRVTEGTLGTCIAILIVVSSQGWKSVGQSLRSGPGEQLSARQLQPVGRAGSTGMWAPLRR